MLTATMASRDVDPPNANAPRRPVVPRRPAALRITELAVAFALWILPAVQLCLGLVCATKRLPSGISSLTFFWKRSEVRGDAAHQQGRQGFNGFVVVEDNCSVTHHQEMSDGRHQKFPSIGEVDREWHERTVLLELTNVTDYRGTLTWVPPRDNFNLEPANTGMERINPAGAPVSPPRRVRSTRPSSSSEGTPSRSDWNPPPAPRSRP